MSIALLVGDRHSGKTSTCRRLVEVANARGFSVGGILAPAVHASGQCVGYDVVDLATGKGTRLATTGGGGTEQAGRFHFLPAGLTLGRAALDRAIDSPHQLIIVDEVGPLELDGGGWSEKLDRLVGCPGVTLAVVRRELAATVAARWSAPARSRFDLGQGADAVIGAVMRLVDM